MTPIDDAIKTIRLRLHEEYEKGARRNVASVMYDFERLVDEMTLLGMLPAQRTQQP